jgi:hypothetical protein
MLWDELPFGRICAAIAVSRLTWHGCFSRRLDYGNKWHGCLLSFGNNAEKKPVEIEAMLRPLFAYLAEKAKR